MKIFAAPSNYKEMLDKIGMFTFFSLLIIMTVIRSNILSIDEFLTQYEGPIQITIVDISFGALTVIIALILGLIFRTIKLHDFLSDVLKIRKHFDIKKILDVYCRELNITNYQIDKLYDNRDVLMRKTFYKYATSTPDQSVIDRHYIEMALDQWVWFWIIEETVFCVLFASILSFTFDAPLLAIVFIVFIILCVPLMIYSYKKSIDYSKVEIDLILEDVTRAAEIKGALNEILFG